MRADAFTGGAAGHLEVSAEQRDGQHHLRKVRWANDAPPGDDGRYFGYQPLRRLLHPNEVPQLLSEPKFELVRDAQSNFSDATIRFRLFTRDGVADFQSVPLKDVPAATTPCR
jgi:hypothetical protein